MRRLRGIWSTLREIRSYSRRDKVVVTLGSLAMAVLAVLAAVGVIENLAFGREDSSLEPLYLGGMVLIIALCTLILLILQPWLRPSRDGLKRGTRAELPHSEDPGDG